MINFFSCTENKLKSFKNLWGRRWWCDVVKNNATRIWRSQQKWPYETTKNKSDIFIFIFTRFLLHVRRGYILKWCSGILHFIQPSPTLPTVILFLTQSHTGSCGVKGKEKVDFFSLPNLSARRKGNKPVAEFKKKITFKTTTPFSLFIYPSIYSSIYLSISLSIYLSPSYQERPSLHASFIVSTCQPVSIRPDTAAITHHVNSALECSGTGADGDGR